MERDEKIFFSKIMDKAQKSQKTGMILNSDFLDPAQQEYAEIMLNKADIDCFFTGGYDGAERTVAVFGDYEEKSLSNIFSLIRSDHSNIKGKKSVLTHRDYLGSLMASGIKREKIGDILTDGDFCDIIVLKEVARYIVEQVISIKDVSAFFTVLDINDIKVPENISKEIKAFVSSLRLDSMVSASFRMARSKAAFLIQQGVVKVNHVADTKVSRILKEGTVISVAGKGRAVFEKELGTSKSGRTQVLITRKI